jgi:hypothetical protein
MARMDHYVVRIEVHAVPVSDFWDSVVIRVPLAAMVFILSMAAFGMGDSEWAYATFTTTTTTSVLARALIQWYQLRVASAFVERTKLTATDSQE